MSFKKILFFSILFISIAGISYGLTDKEKNEYFELGVKLYNEGKFDESIQYFLKLYDSGVKSGVLYYNLGNAYFKAEQLGYSVLWYERAVKLMPQDPELNFNLIYAKNLVTDKNEEYSGLEQILFLKKIFTSEQIKWGGILLCFILCGCFGLKLFIKEQKFIIRFIKILIAAVCFFIITGVYDYYKMNFKNFAVIIPEKVSVKAGIFDESTELFILHSGAKVKIQKETKDHILIFFSKGKIGFIKKSEAVEI
ncbi:MAG: hypothetical protein HQK76_19945 [Desulfobacterales bacterium]|nr:hypothetical protein [Desulfobacterales bacterium]